MIGRALMIAVALAALLVHASAQNSNSSATRARTAAGNSNQQPAGESPAKPPEKPAQTPAEGERRTASTGRAPSAQSPTEGVLAAFDRLIEGIRKADVDQVTDVYWKSPQLLLFNNNGTVTKGWEQMRKNRESSYPELKDVKLEVSDLHVQMLGSSGAVVTCLWTQSQTFRGTAESASGRMTLVLRRVGGAWKAVHLHTSPDAPVPSRVMPSEQATPKPTPGN